MLQWRVFTLRSLMLSSQGQAKAGNAQQCTAMHSNAQQCTAMQHAAACLQRLVFLFDCPKWQSTATEKCLQCFACVEVGCLLSKLVPCSYEKLRQLMAVLARMVPTFCETRCFQHFQRHSARNSLVFSLHVQDCLSVPRGTWKVW